MNSGTNSDANGSTLGGGARVSVGIMLVCVATGVGSVVYVGTMLPSIVAGDESEIVIVGTSFGVAGEVQVVNSKISRGKPPIALDVLLMVTTSSPQESEFG